MAGLWISSVVVNHVGILGSMVAEGFFGVPTPVLYNAAAPSAIQPSKWPLIFA